MMGPSLSGSSDMVAVDAKRRRGLASFGTSELEHV
jgi:hypothetical protein